MPLHLITGRANAGKTGYLYEPLVRAARSAGSPVLLVPSAPEVRRAISEFTEKHVMGIEVRTLDAWIAGLWVLHGDGRAVVTDVARQIHMAKAVQAVGLDALSGSASHVGFVQLLCELARRAVTRPRALDGSPETEEIALILAEYYARIEAAGLIESAHAAAQLADRDLGPLGPIAVSRFTDLSEAQERFVVHLARASEVSVGLTWEAGFPATEALDPLVARLSGVADDHVVIAEEPGGDRELQNVADALFQQDGGTVRATGSVEVGEAGSPEAESAVCAQIAARLIREGLAADRIAVGFRDVPRRASLLKAAFAAEDVEVQIDASVRFSATPFGAATIALLKGVGLEARRDPSEARERILAYLLSPYSGADAAEVVRLDRRWRLDGIRDASRLLGAAERLGEGTRRCIQAARRALRDSDATAAWQELAAALLQNGAGRHRLGTERSKGDAAAHAALIRTIDESTGQDGSVDSVGIASALESVTVHGEAEPNACGVLVTEVHRLRSLRFDALVLGGLSWNEFSAEKGEPLVARIAPRLGIAAGSDERLSERMLFYSVVTRAKKHLALVRQATSATGEPSRASLFWDELLDLYRDPQDQEAHAGGVPAGMRVTRVSMSDVSAAAPSFSAGRREMRRAAARRGSSAASAMGVALGERALEQLAARDVFRVTELETYATCPYRWFYAYALGTKSIDRELDAAARGSYAHDLLATFYRRALPEMGVSRIDAATLPLALSMLDELMPQVRRDRGVRPFGVAEELELARAEAWVRQVVVDDQQYLPGYVPTSFEREFGREEPFVFGEVRIAGRIDRIDVGPAGVIVTDYKSSSDVKGARTFDKWRILQIPVYAEAAGRALGLPVVGGVYRSIRTLKTRGFYDAESCEIPMHGSTRDALDTGAIAEILASAHELAKSAADGIRVGRIEPDPQTSDACAFCGAASLCPKARVSA